MSPDKIIELANKAYAIDDGKPLHPSTLFHLEIFANLVAQLERERIATSIERLPFGDTAQSFVAFVRGMKK